MPAADGNHVSRIGARHVTIVGQARHLTAERWSLLLQTGDEIIQAEMPCVIQRKCCNETAVHVRCLRLTKRSDALYFFPSIAWIW